MLRVAAIRIIAARLAEQAPGVSVEEFLGLQAAAFKKVRGKKTPREHDRRSFRFIVGVPCFFLLFL